MGQIDIPHAIRKSQDGSMEGDYNDNMDENFTMEAGCLQRQEIENESDQNMSSLINDLINPVYSKHS
jgi:hypothetical protein